MKGKPPFVSKRDTSPSEFALILRRVCEAVSTVRVAAFVDMEGECVDYYSSLDPYEAKVVAAQTVPIVAALAVSNRKLQFGEPHTFEIATENNEIWARRISDEYLLVALAVPDKGNDRMRRVLAHAVREFRTDAGIAPPPWEPLADILTVETRDATGWQYAPAAFCEDGKRVAITAVLGRWVEPGELRSNDKICFRVRTEQGMEMTLVHDPDVNQWTSRL